MSIEVGTKLPGKVSGITNFGAFVDLGEGKTGLVHISEVSNSFVKDIKDVLKVNDEVEVKVMSVGDDGKIGLSIKRANEEERPAQRERKEYKRSSNNYQSDRNNNRGNDRGKNNRKPAAVATPQKESFDSLMSNFLKDSDDRLSTLKRSTEGKRGGRGGRRN
ncbi:MULTISPECIES: S1 domain-containing RNA-binding protein [Vagococcus]|uniref:S1 domain-containing RNA-binding protein n=1 Tax=Vagococcus TaxID=2737 RepID=UPI000E48D7A2|nr:MULTISPECIES: S1 domain-containing RNA-binding protein [Vagococcus]RHH68056.1 RNA-binding protein S1 [Vagococcus sp. AM17-17]